MSVSDNLGQCVSKARKCRSCRGLGLSEGLHKQYQVLDQLFPDPKQVGFVLNQMSQIFFPKPNLDIIVPKLNQSNVNCVH